METKVSEKNYNLSKVKLLPGGGIDAEYQITEMVGGEPSVTDYKATVNRDIHPDLKDLFEDLRPIVARVFGITSFLSLTESGPGGIGLSDSQVKLCRNFADELVQKVDVRGVTWSGTAEKVGVVVTAVLETPNGLKTAINTPRIKLETISFGFEEELQEITEAIRAEVFQFLFYGKQAQLSLFGGDDASKPAEDNPDDMLDE